MSVRFTQYSAEELAQRGQEIYEREIRPHVEADHYGKVVAIDVRTGEYELGDDAISTTSRLRLRQPEAEIWLVRVGHSTYRYIRRS